MIASSLLAAALHLTLPQDGVGVDRDRLDRAPPRPSNTAAVATSATGPDQPAPSTVAPFVLRDVIYDATPQVRAMIESAVRPFIGQTLDDEGLARLRAATSEALGRRAGLPIVAVDTTRAGEGVLKITALPGRAGRIAIYGETDQGVGLLHQYAARLAADAPLRRATSERYLSLIADISGATTTLQTAPSATPGAVDLGFDVDFRRWRAETVVNNGGSRTLGRVQITGAVELNGALRFGDQTRLAVTVPTDPDRFQHITLTHRQPLGADGAALTVGLGRLRTRVENLQGDASTASAVVSWPMIRSYRQNLVLSGGIDALNSDNAVFGDLRATERTRALRASAAWSRVSPTTIASAGLTFSHGLDQFGAEVDALTDPDFAKVNTRLDLAHSLGRQFRVSGALAAQWSDDRTPTAELFSLGGWEFGRGFTAGLLVGDSGYGAKVEGAWRPAFLPRPVQGSELYAFADGGEVRVNARDAFPARSDGMLSAGLGVRLALADRAVIELEGATALDDPRPGGDGGTRFGFGLSARF